jgi:hypothetical protein
MALDPYTSAALVNVAGTGLQAYQSGRNIKKTHRYNVKMADYTFNKNLEMWKLQNQYNSPQAQMQRLQEAGLNPHLMYGKGTVGNAQTMPQYVAPQGDFRGQQNVIGSMAQAGLGAAAQAQQVENLKILNGINRFAQEVAEATVDTKIASQKADLTAKTIANTLAGFQSAHYQELKSEGLLKEKAYAELEQIERQTRQVDYKNLSTKYGFDNAGTGIRMIGYYLVQNRVSATNPNGFTDNEIRMILGAAHVGTETLSLLKQVGLALSPRSYIKEVRNLFPHLNKK